MRKTSVFAIALSTLLGASVIAPAEAMPIQSPTVNRTTDVQQARVVIKYGYYRGHRGYRNRRAGYRFYNGFWYPGVAFGPAIVIRPGGWCGPRWRRHRC